MGPTVVPDLCPPAFSPATRPPILANPAGFPGIPAAPKPGTALLLGDTTPGRTFPVRAARDRIAVYADVGPDDEMGSTGLPFRFFDSQAEADGFHRAIVAILDLMASTPTGRAMLDAAATLYPLPELGATDRWGGPNSVFDDPATGSPAGVTVLIGPALRKAETFALAGGAVYEGRGSVCAIALPADFAMAPRSAVQGPGNLFPPDVHVAHEFMHVLACLTGASWPLWEMRSETLPLRGEVPTPAEELLAVGGPLRDLALGRISAKVPPYNSRALKAKAKLILTARQFAATADPSRAAAADAMQAMRAHYDALASGTYSEYQYALERGLTPRTHYQPDYRPDETLPGSAPTYHLAGETGSDRWAEAMRRFSRVDQDDPLNSPRLRLGRLS